MDEQQYTEWFNKGYELSKHKPELASQISNALSKNDDNRASGFKDGQHQYALEKEQAKQPAYLKTQNYIPKSMPNHTPAKDKNKGKGRDFG